MSSTKYRPDIDGLRALAVLAVIVFHMSSSLLSGGFVGVDVFFVISGWLITGQIVAAVENGTFSILEFYKRRVVRIFPALWVMMLVLLVWGYFRMFPDEFIQLAKTIVATAFSFSNIYFYSTINYFDDRNKVNPVLHTWSLGVEEQFYIFFPLIIILIERYFRPRRNQILFGLLILSFAASASLTYTNTSAAFYLPFSRAWELLVGSLLAVGSAPIAIRSRLGREALLACGLLAIGLAYIFLNDHTPFPGVAALLPVLGAGAIILAGTSGKTTVGKVLTWRPVVFIGTISYSLYLWHMPLIVMQRIGGFGETGLSAAAERVLVVLAAFPIAVASLWFIETPFRKVSLAFPRGKRAVFALSGMAVVCSLAIAVLSTSGVPERFPSGELKMASYLTYDPTGDFREGKCFVYDQYTFQDFDQSVCLARDPAKKTYMLIGDSHAAHLYSGLSSVFGGRENVIQATATGCKPVLDDREGHSVCAKMNRFIFDAYLPTHRVDLLIISARWDATDISPLRRTLEWAHAHQIPAAVVGPSMEFDVQLPRLLAVATENTSEGDLKKHLLLRFKVLNRQMQAMVDETHTQYIDLYSLLCPSNCIYSSGNVPIMFDTGHLTRPGSLLVAEEFKRTGQME